MNIAGIIAEYDPFHRGHEYHLKRARELTHAGAVYVMLSGCVRQRGEMAMLNPYDRAACALECGADAVFALPVLWTVTDAEHYALGAVASLAEKGATHLVFGAERGDLASLQRLAGFLEEPTEAFDRALRTGLDAGLGYPRALSAAAESALPGGEAGKILREPNNILALCYLRAIRRLGADLEPVAVPRTGGYHSSRVSPTAPSASALRKALLRGDWAGAWAAVPGESEKVIRRAFLRGRICREERLDPLLMSRLREMSGEELSNLPDLSEGLEVRLQKAARTARSRRELLDAVCTSRYPRARISRICACAMLGITRERRRELPGREPAVLLGLRRTEGMTSAWKREGRRMETRFLAAEDLRAWKVWNTGAGLPDTLPFSEKIISLPDKPPEDSEKG